MNKKKIPLIKEYRIYKLKGCLQCIDRYLFNREKQRDCILDLYLNKKGKSIEHREKSIFRGMVLPSVRYLGLIIGNADSIKASANGKLIIESQDDQKLHQRVLRAITYEVDKDIFNFIPIIKNLSMPKQEFIQKISNKIEGVSEKQKIERIDKWLSILHQVELINYSSSQIISINKKKYKQTIDDVNVDMKNFKNFKEYFFESYFELSRKYAGVVDITDLREYICLKILKSHKDILTENQFDEMLSRVLSETKEYIISLGRPWGAREKLFKFEGNSYKTIIVKKYQKEGDKNG